ncbi:MAG TPA: phenylalanine--tRNA ligase subunit alpha [Vicinamibacteria bacterium]|nr:phenylalanine--tRNA ligase subunit alpha [Vicinamibacteria bacterium]
MSDAIQEVRDRARALRAEFDAALAAAGDAAALQGVRDRFLGRKSGAVSGLLKSLGRLPEAGRREAGQELNALKAAIERGLDEAGSALEGRTREEALRRDRVDGTLPGRRPHVGRRHPLTVVRQELEDIFVAMGYEVYDGPEVEDDYHNFEALNMPPDHPARDMQDTFYLEGEGGLLLRTHTSSAQIRYMVENPHPPDVRIICPGKVFRRDSDVTHAPMFQQIEGLVVGEGIHLGHLKGTIEAFLHALFGEQYPVRFRASYFPYTEPSVEADLGCIVCGGAGRLGASPCRVCKATGWLEILGSGMVHPAVFEAVNARLGRVVYDPEAITGFAFGLGIERVAMVRHGIDDIRIFYENDLRFLEQFPG